ncbi:MAG: DMT family transporter [Ardenticatenaceae bacterium]|nr:DMT family transporter [Ardenticatenaceae bacterium]
MRLSDWGFLTFLSLIWGGSFFFGEIALEEIRPLTVVFGRVFIAAIVLNFVVIFVGLKMPRQIKLWGAFFAMGLLNNLIPFALIFWGQTQITSGLASILNAATPFWTVILAHFGTADEKLRPNRLIGVLVGVGGVAIIIGPAAFEGASAGMWGQVAVIGATISYAIAGIFGRRFAGTPALVTASGQVTATSILMVPYIVIFDQPWQGASVGASTWLALLGLGVISTAVAYIVYFRLLRSVGATNLLLVTLLIPISALSLGVLFLDEPLELRQLAGMTVIGFGLLTARGR